MENSLYPENDVLETYKDCIKAYLNGDIQKMASYFDDDIVIIGSAGDELFRSKKEAFEYYQTTANQVTGVVDVRNRNIKVQMDGPAAWVTELADLYVQIDGQWTLYSPFRVSVFMMRKEGSWKMVTQHGSVPDARAGEGQQLNPDDLLAENVRLQEAIKRRTMELEAKNREQEIEASLERVRSRSLAMSQSSEIQLVINTVFEQLRSLGLDMNVASIFIFKVGSRDWEQWVATADTSYSTCFSIPYYDHPIFRDLEAAKVAGESFYTIKYNKEVKNKWFEYAFANTEYRRIPDHRKAYLLDSDFYLTAFALMPTTGIQLAKYTGEAFSDEECSILRQFSRVFEQAYIRFKDLQKAEEQAREARIEAALERVRAKTMAMHNSQDVGATVALLFDELTTLGMEPNARCGIGILNDSPFMELWTASTRQDGQVELNIGRIDMTKHPLLIGGRQAWLDHIPGYSYVLEGDDLVRYFAIINAEPEYSFHVDLNTLPGKFYFNEFVFSDGLLYAFTREPLRDDMAKICARFTKVFGQTYRRYQDLIRAEEQAREAQIQLALERVRARTMAMQSSEELAEVSYLLNKQVVELGIPTRGCAFNIYNKKDSTEWFSSLEGTIPTYNTPRENIFLKYYEAGQRGESLWIEAFDRARIKEHYRYLATLSVTDDNDKTIEENVAVIPERQFDHVAYFKYGYLLFITLDPAPQAHDIFRRFANEFEQTYTRFLDLKKVEEQSREKEIQLALERVRSKTMAMHESGDLRDVVYVLFQQVSDLDLADLGCNINLFHPENRIIETWLAGTDQEPIPKSYFIQVDHPYLTQMWTSWENQDPPFLIYSTGASHESYKNLILETCYQDMPDEFKAYVRENPEAYLVHFNMPCGQIQAVSSKTLSEESISILQRFAAVFQQSYTRFLDLKKAEAQAREAHIETALERVRARTMAMTSSEDLQDVTALIFNQLQLLELNIPAAGFIIYEENGDSVHWLAGFGTDSFPECYYCKHFDHPYLDAQYQDWKEGIKYKSYLWEGELKKSVDDYFFNHTDFSRLPEELKSAFTSIPSAYNSDAFMKYGILEAIGEALSEYEATILQRFALVFEQAYTRFLDIKNAEALAHETEIQLAFERVRARAMAMHHSGELMEVATELRAQMASLGQQDLEVCAIHLYEEADDTFESWGAMREPGLKGRLFEGTSRFPKKGLKIVEEMLQHYQAGTSDYILVNEGEKGFEWLEALKTHAPQAYAMLAQSIENTPVDQLKAYWSVSDFSGGALVMVTYTTPEENSRKLLRRSANVFDLAYRRYQDLKKTEDQAKEAEIQLALERVRARTMAMHQSDELRSVIHTIFEQLKALGFDATACGLTLFNKEDKSMVLWLAGFDTDAYPESYFVPYFDHPLYNAQYGAWENGQTYQVFKFEGELKKSYDDLIFELGGYKDLPASAKEAITSIETATNCTAFMKYGMFESVMIGHKMLTEQQAETLQRFAKVFEQTYTRFLDLQKAEGQAREAQIEAALEKVRSRTMGMRHSDELPEVASLLFREVSALRVPVWSCGYNILSEDKKFCTSIMSAEGGLQKPIRVPLNEHESFLPWYEAIQNNEEFLVYRMEGNDLKKHYDYMQTLPGFQEFENSGIELPACQINHLVRFKQGFLLFIASDELPAAYDVFKRFSVVFEQTYTRFLDLQKAENQAREAQIETALERVRSRAMIMHQSSEIKEVVSVLHRQLINLAIPAARCYIYVVNEDTVDLWLSISLGAEIHQFQLLLGWEDVPALVENHKRWTRGDESASYVFRGDEVREWYEGLIRVSKGLFPRPPAIPEFQQNIEVFNQYGGIGIVNHELVNEEDVLQPLKRFGNSYVQVYTRFRDLQLAEEQAKESLKQAALDRVRGEIATMRTTEDLNRITPVIWNELTALNVPFIRCGVFIMDEQEEIIHNYLSTPDGKAIATFHLPYTTPGAIANILKHWQKRKKLIDHWDKQDMLDFANVLVGEGIFKTAEEYLDTLPAEGFYLHFLPFVQGMLYVGNLEPVNASQIDLVQSLANTFSTAYARYEDFNRLETAKKQVDLALEEVKKTQQQLIQSEKMASLGELTAGIAHEIQNPLNFVNNFSEVNRELIEELKDAIAKNELEEIQVILQDLSDNEEKVKHHGKRAEGIVKSMLQHSRTSSGNKELTDINALCDEYLRLAYHGFRAKNKSFNAELKTKFDPNLPKLKVAPQDIGRVVLNIINNAFQAMHGMENPVMILSTKQVDDHLEIRIADNGPGIPDEIKDKIFQPFFTTKPTGQGTGLGLSLAYDIVKAHGGTIQVESASGRGTKFIIRLPKGS